MPFSHEMQFIILVVSVSLYIIQMIRNRNWKLLRICESVERESERASYSRAFAVLCSVDGDAADSDYSVTMLYYDYYNRNYIILIHNSDENDDDGADDHNNNDNDGVRGSVGCAYSTALKTLHCLSVCVCVCPRFNE